MDHPSGRPRKTAPDIRLQFRASPIFKAKLKQLATKRKTTVSKILRAYVRYCLRKDGESVDVPLESEAYFPEWMHE